MDCKTNEFEKLLEQKEKEPARFIEFPLGQKVAINGYWFETEKVENNRLILKPIGMPNSYKKEFFRGKRQKNLRENLYNKTGGNRQ